VRVALVGYGLAGRIFHAPLLSSDPGFEVVSVVTGDAERAAAAAADLPGARVVPDLAALLERAGDHDLAVVATTTGTHVPVAAATVAAGLATVVDKPIAATAAPARALVEDAERRGVALTVFQNRRWDSDTLAIRALLAAGTLGSVLRFESRFERFRPVVRATWRESGRVEDGAGVLLDLGSHLASRPFATVAGTGRTTTPSYCWSTRAGSCRTCGPAWSRRRRDRGRVCSARPAATSRRTWTGRRTRCARGAARAHRAGSASRTGCSPTRTARVPYRARRASGAPSTRACAGW
jgi:hypothetical protein